jgi:signal transduction histidine kinase/CheY-like chemotaxis protein
VHPEDLAPAEAKLKGAIAGGGSWEAIAGGDFLEMDYRIVTQGGLRWMHARAHVVRNPDGQAVRMIGIDMDITERRELEDALRTLTKTLELRIEQEVAAREAAQARAAQAERIQALGQLAGGIAHDFNNVLQATMGAFSLIERRPNDHDGIRRIARMAGEACERGASITRRLLSFARRGDLRAGRVDIGELLAGLQEILSHTLGAGIDVRVEIEGNLGPALVDRSQLETVLVNLATNARDAMPGGGRLVFSATLETLLQEGGGDGSPHLSGLAPGAYVRLAVADTGQGMDAATLGRAGEPFFTTKGHGEGTGLGLSMAKGFVEQSGGAFSITSTLGLGTTITLWLPEAAPGVLAQAPACGSAAEADPFTGAPRKRVLLVDDQDSVRKILAAQLRDAGFDVVPAAGGEQAIALLAGGLQVDALVSDLSMPQVDGLAVISAAQQHLPRLPAILLTGYAGDDAALAVSGAISGSFSLLRKPVEDAHLVDRLSTLLAACEV